MHDIGSLNTIKGTDKVFGNPVSVNMSQPIIVHVWELKLLACCFTTLVRQYTTSKSSFLMINIFVQLLVITVLCEITRFVHFLYLAHFKSES